MTCCLLRLSQGLSFVVGGMDCIEAHSLYLAAVPISLCQLPSLKNDPGAQWSGSCQLYVLWEVGALGKAPLVRSSGKKTRWCLMFSWKTLPVRRWMWQVIFHLCCRLYSLGGNVGLLHGVGLLYNHCNKAYRRADQNKL